MCVIGETVSAEDEPAGESANPLSHTAQDIENYNIGTPEHNLYILVGQESGINPAERLNELSVKDFIGTSAFFGLRSLLKHNQLNLAYRTGKCINEFQVNDDENWRLEVVFQANAATGKWQVKQVTQIKNGQPTARLLPANDPLYQQNFVASSGCGFAEFPSVWQALKGKDSGFWKSSDTIEKLTLLYGQRAVFDNLVFFHPDLANHKHKILTAVCSIQLEYARPDPKQQRFQNGWLISGFEFLDDDGQDYDLDKSEDIASAIIPPTPMKVVRKKPSQASALDKPNPVPPAKANDPNPHNTPKPQSKNPKKPLPN